VAMRMRTTLLLCVLSVSFGMASLSLLIVRSVVQKQIRGDIAAGLERSIVTFRNIQSQQEQTLHREVSLLAALPVLKSLMTTADPRTIRDGAAGYSNLSGGDLFALADAGGSAIALFENPDSPGNSSAVPPPPSSAEPAASLDPAVFLSGERHYVLLRGHLYVIAAAPLYFGSAASGTKLGYVLLGYAVNHRVAQEVRQVASAEVVFCANGTMAASTLDPASQQSVAARMPTFLAHQPSALDLWLGREHFIGASTVLSAPADPTVQLVVLESWSQASQYLAHLNQVLLVLGGFLLVLSGLLAIWLATSITRPLDRLVAGARALGAGNFDYQLRSAGAREIRELGEAFDRMRSRLRDAQQELLAAERLATIGRMASSISHDLRHYLSAVYANAEFLGYGSAGAQERSELLTEIRQGVRGMTDLIESLLLFSRSGQVLQLSWESLPYIVERSVAMARAHPDAQNIAFALAPMPPIEARIDALKIERAVYNLLLNACQAARLGTEAPRLQISLAEDGDSIRLRIADNGPGVPDSIRTTLFQPFVSEGKPSGIGLGLALANKIAQEHGGSVTLEESRPGSTVFVLSLAKATLRSFAVEAQPPEAPLAAK
jgi:signal transduction histidine kinase